MPATHAVVVVGPNLPCSLARKGTFHVHAAGCADLKRGPIREHARGVAAEQRSSLVELCDSVYPPSDFQCESGEYLGEFYVAPCCTLPDRAENS